MSLIVFTDCCSVKVERSPTEREAESYQRLEKWQSICSAEHQA